LTYTLQLDDTELFNPFPLAPGEQCRLIGGIPGLGGVECAKFRKSALLLGGNDDSDQAFEDRPINPSILEKHIDFDDLLTNAEDCGGNPLTSGSDEGSVAGLPRCTYSLPIVRSEDFVQ
jgi:hypothetical protein